MFYICTILKKTSETLSMSKNLLKFILFMLMLSTAAKAQRHEIGVQLGISNLVGDIGRTNYVFQPFIGGNFSQFGVPFYGGVLYRMNFNPYQTVRLNLGYSHIQFSDAAAQEFYRRNRGLFGTNNMYHADLLFEYNFLPVNDEQQSMISPYIFGGVGMLLPETVQVVLENDFNRDPSGNPIAPTSETDFVTNATYSVSKKMTMAIPFGVGLKYKFNYNWAIFGEFTFRPTFSDAIDHSMISEKNAKILYNKDILNPDQENQSLLQAEPYAQVAQDRAAAFLKNRQIGNTNSKDWVNSMTLGLTYSFGRPPCYCETK